MPAWGQAVLFPWAWELGAMLMPRGLGFFIRQPMETSRSWGRLNPLSLPSIAEPPLTLGGEPGILFPQPEVSGAL